jgi:hypothetical protein
LPPRDRMRPGLGSKRSVSSAITKDMARRSHRLKCLARERRNCAIWRAAWGSQSPQSEPRETNRLYRKRCADNHLARKIRQAVAGFILPYPELPLFQPEPLLNMVARILVRRRRTR